MTKTDSLLFIVEGEKREQDLLSSLSALFSPKSDPIIIPVSMNIYMLYALLQKDGFYTDIVEVLREQFPAAKEKLQGYSRDSFSGVYLFFDFDKQANNLRNGTEADYSNTLRKMLDRFGDATEDGKLYLSYPMVEAFRDFAPESCAIPSGKCFVKREDFSDYKNASSVSPYQQISHYTFPTWQDLTRVYSKRICCLLGLDEIDRELFLRSATQKEILEKQLLCLAKFGSAFVLSSVPAFLIEYSERLYISLMGNQRLPRLVQNCLQRLEVE